MTELRGAIAKAYAKFQGALPDPGYWQFEYGEDLADAILALPEIAELREKAAGADRVRKLHRGVVNWSSPECETCSTYCDEDCGHIEPWPCPTARALDGEQP